jgi:hypothetical protein
MMKRLFISLISLFSFSLQSQDTLTLMHYNLLMFGNNTSWCTQSNNNYVDKTGYLKTIVDYVKPDILTVNEINMATLYHDYVLNNALNVNGIDYYQRGNPPNHSNSYIINQIFYNSEKLTMISNLAIENNYRDIDIFRLKVEQPGLQNDVYLNCVIAHLKAGDSPEDESERASETSKLMNYLNNTNVSGNYTMSGDFNVYTASEQAFQNLLFYTNANIRFYDPINKIGAWNNNSFFESVHTQSTHINGDCFSSGGLDDRFDFILASDEIINGSDYMKYVPNSYTALGQDGEHFNKSLTSSPQNNSVPEDVLEALYSMSDHLPVVMKIIVGENLGLQKIREQDFTVTMQNPIHSELKLMITTRKHIDLVVHISNPLGQLLFSGFYPMDQSTTSVQIPFAKFPQGMYLMQIGEYQSQLSTWKIIKN